MLQKNATDLSETINSLTVLLNEEKSKFETQRISLETELSFQANEIKNYESQIAELQSKLIQKDADKEILNAKILDDQELFKIETSSLKNELETKSSELDEVQTYFKNTVQNLEEKLKIISESYNSLVNEHEQSLLEHRVT